MLISKLSVHTICIVVSLFSLQNISLTSALFVVDGSGCVADCRSAGSGTDFTDVPCYDHEFNATGSVSILQKCIACELRQDAWDSDTGQSNVGWALCELFVATFSHYFTS